ncbi:class II 3-deoxy-7-phosphoheptulonate synthase [Dermabacteraceae bacterium P13095]
MNLPSVSPVTATTPSLSEDEQLAHLASWRELPALQQPRWPDENSLREVFAALRSAPPLVFAGEVDLLRTRLADAAEGKAFLLQGGDCAETFAESTAHHIRNKIRTILQMSVVLTYGASMPIIKMGRMAGQFAKPRSQDTETRNGVTLPCYRGDAVNGYGFTEAERTPDPQRLWRAYTTSASTLNLIRAFIGGGLADLREVHSWNRGFVKGNGCDRYEQLAHDIDKALRFMEACGSGTQALKAVEFFSSHEALLLDYEEALSRVDTRTGNVYDCSGHFLWIGERTRQLDGAHVKFLSQVRNPIGVKLGPSTKVDDALRLIDALDPEREPGRLTFITRMGARVIRDKLPELISGVQAEGGRVAWVCDPMHGNTITSSNGYKTRRFSDVMNEVTGFFEVHRALGSIPAGLHTELTGDDVSEILGGTEKIDEAGLARRYETLVDPRLNHQQSLELAFLVAEMLAA